MNGKKAKAIRKEHGDYNEYRVMKAQLKWINAQATIVKKEKEAEAKIEAKRHAKAVREDFINEMKDRFK